MGPVCRASISDFGAQQQEGTKRVSISLSSSSSITGAVFAPVAHVFHLLVWLPWLLLLLFLICSCVFCGSLALVVLWRIWLPKPSVSLLPGSCCSLLKPPGERAQRASKGIRMRAERREKRRSEKGTEEKGREDKWREEKINVCRQLSLCLLCLQCLHSLSSLASL